MQALGEHQHRVVKGQFGFKPVRYRGLAEHAAEQQGLLALPNLGLARCHQLAAAG